MRIGPVLRDRLPGLTGWPRFGGNTPPAVSLEQLPDVFVRTVPPASQAVLSANREAARTLPQIRFGRKDIQGVPVAHADIYRLKNGNRVRAVVTMDDYNTDDGDVGFKLYVRNRLVGETDLMNDDKSIYVSGMEAPGNTTYKGIGTTLHQLAVETSIQRGFKGRVSLYSLSDAVGFHYKSGFRADDPRTNREIRQAIRDAKRTGTPREVDIGQGVTMALTRDTLKKWKTRIAQDPILPEGVVA